MDFQWMRDQEYSLISAVREGRLEIVEELITFIDLAYSSGGWTDGYVLLCEALKNNHSEIAKLLLKNGSKVNSKNKNPTATPLHLAVRNGDIEIVQMFLDKGANIDAECEYGATPLHVAVQTKRMEITKLLLSRGANVNAEGSYRITMFYNAMMRRNEEMLGDLSEHGIHPNSLRNSTLLPESFTPLHVAVRNGSKEIIKLLLNRGANVNVKGKYGITPLHIAMEEGDLQIVELLLNQGANINSAYTSSSMKGYTPLCIAVINRQEEVVKLLLERGANVNAQDQDGKTILHFAVEDRCSLIIEHLLRHSPDVNNNSNKCALNIAMHGCEKKYSKIVKDLLQYKFYVDFSNENDCKSLPDTVLKEYQKINEEHCKYGTDINMIPVTGIIVPKPKSFGTPFIPKHITQLVIADGAAVTSDSGKTPIFYAAEKNRREIIEVLLQHGADVNSGDGCGKGPFSEKFLEGPHDKVLDIGEKRGIARLHLSRQPNIDRVMNSLYLTEDNYIVFIKPYEIVSQNSYVESVEVSLKLVDFKDKDGRTVLHVASDYSNLEIVEVLLKFGVGTDPEDEQGATVATPVHIASKRSKPEIVEVLLRFGAGVNSKDQYGRTALHIASENSNLEMLEALLKLGAGVDFRDENGETALHVASENSNAQIVEVLLKFHSDIDSKDHCGRTALHIASKTGNLEIVEILLKNGAGANFKDKRGRTALYIASRWSNVEIVEVLLKFGADIHLKDDAGQTAFHIASLQNKSDIHEVLLKFGADIDSNDKNGRTALHIASEKDDLEIVEALLKFGADIDSTDTNGKTALHVASENSNAQIVEVLLKFDSDIDSKDHCGRTALHFASENYNLEIVEVLLKFGADIDSKDKNGTTALHIASEHNDTDIVEALLKFGAGVDIRDANGKTALHIASGTWRSNVVEVLLKFGADIDSKDKNGRTALHIAAEMYSADIVEVLLKFGVGVDFKDEDGRTALHIASENNNRQVAWFLLNFGAGIDSQDREGRTPLCIACKNGNYETALVLLAYGSDIPIVSETEDSGFRVDMNRGNSDDDGYNFVIPGNISLNFIRYAVMVKAANLYVRNKNLASIRTDDERLRDFQNKCENEVASMKSEVVGNANISFYDILTKGLSQLVIYAGNESIVQVFGSDDYKRKFPIYATLINSRFRQGKRRRELMVQGNKNFYFFTNSLGIPYDCTEKIFNYLSNDDLRSIMHACKPISVSSLNTDKK